MRPVITVDAPGKMMIAGEYAVLDGAPAVVAAVSRRLSVKLGPGPKDTDLPLEVVESLRLACQARGTDPDFSILIDASSLRHEDEKLGLGSSAAAAVATAGAVFAHSGANLDEPACRDQIFQIANEGHRSVAPHGSGADVCAAAFGGWRRFQLAAGVPLSQPIIAPSSLELRVIWTGVSARTSSFLSKVRTLRSFEPRVYERRREAIGEAAEAFIHALGANAGREILDTVFAHHRALEALGADCGAPIVEARLHEIAEIAREHGGAAKGSGAGGGDVALGVFLEASAADAFADACRARSFLPLNIELGARGVGESTR